MFRLIAILLLVALFAPVGPASVRAQGLTPVSVALDWYPNANHAGLLLAQERGYFAAEGLDVEFYTPSDPSTVLQTVGAGRDTFGISYQTEVLFARAQEVPVVSVAALTQHPLNCLMALQEQNISRPRDLVGKAVGIAGLPSDEAFLAAMLAADGVTIDEVEVVTVGYDLLPALIAGRVDAIIGGYWTHETILAEQEGYPVDVLRVEEWGVPDHYELVITTAEQTLAQQPELVEAFLRATQRGYEEAIADPDAALDILLTANPELDPDVEAQGLLLLIPVWTDGVPAFGIQTAERWQTFAAWLADQDLLPDDFDVSGAFTTELLPGEEGMAAHRW